MSYIHKDYPAMRYRENGETRVVQNSEEDEFATDEGFVSHPSLIGQPKPEPKAPEAPKPPEPKAPEAPKPARPKKGSKDTPLEVAIKETEFDRTAAIKALEAADFDVDPATTDDELKEALAELAKAP